jgi:hypothetical protein
MTLNERKAHDMADILIGLHQKKFAWEKKLKRALTSVEILQLKLSTMVMAKIQKGQWGHYWGFARTTGRYWDAFCKIILGEVLGKFVRPTALTKFHASSGLPQDEVLPIFEMVIAGTITLKEMESTFNTMRMVAKCRTIVSVFLGHNGFNCDAHHDGTTLEWESLCLDAMIPEAFKDSTMIRDFADTAIRNKTKVSEKTIPGLLDHLKVLLKQAEEVRLLVVFHVDKAESHMRMQIHHRVLFLGKGSCQSRLPGFRKRHREGNVDRG